MSTSRTFRKPPASYVIHASSSFPSEGASVCSATEAFCGASTVFFDSTFGFTGATVLDFDGELCAGAGDAFFSAPRPKRTEAFNPSEEAFDLDLFPVVAVTVALGALVFDDAFSAFDDSPFGELFDSSPAL